MFNFLKEIFPSKSEVKQGSMPESVKQAQEYLPDSIKNLPLHEIEKKIRKITEPNKWLITRAAASGCLHKQPFVGGNSYKGNYTSELRRQRRLKQIEKGIIKITKENEDGTSSS